MAKKTTEEQQNLSNLEAEEHFEDLVHRASTLIDQLNHLYTMYVNGIETTPPLQKRMNLDQIMVKIRVMGKPTQAALFRFNEIQARYQSYKQRWEKQMKDLEAGKIRRN